MACGFKSRSKHYLRSSISIDDAIYISMRILRSFLNEAMKWDLDEFGKAYRAAWQAGKTLQELADEMGLSYHNLAMRAQQYNNKQTNDSQRLPSFKDRDAPWRMLAKMSPTSQKQEREISIHDIESALLASGGNVSAAAKSLNITYMQLSKLVSRINAERAMKNQQPIMKAGRGRPKRTDTPTPDEFKEIWDSSEDRRDAVKNINDAYPTLTPEFIKMMAWKLKKQLGDDFIRDLPDRRATRWKLNDEPIVVPDDVVQDEHPDVALDTYDAFEPPEEFIQDEEPVEFEQPEDVHDTEDMPMMSFDDENDAEQHVAASDKQKLTPSEMEMVAVWNASDSPKEALKKLKKLDWSFGQPAHQGHEELSPLKDLKSRIELLRARGIDVKAHPKRLSYEEGKKLNTALVASLVGLGALDDYNQKHQAVGGSNLAQKHTLKKHKEPIVAPETSINIDDEQPTETSSVSQTTTPTRTYSRRELHRLVQRASKRYEVPAAFIDAIIRTESNYNPRAVSSVGAQGIMQIMPRTARGLGLRNAFDPAQAIDAGTRHLRQLLDRFENDYELAAAAYNAGQANVERYDGVPPFPETQAYVRSVKAKMEDSLFAAIE